jgi:hypothetical protein
VREINHAHGTGVICFLLFSTSVQAQAIPPTTYVYVTFSMYPHGHTIKIAPNSDNLNLRLIEVPSGNGEYNGALRAPAGYKICTITFTDYHIGSQGTLNGGLQDNMQQMSYYAASHDEGVGGQATMYVVALDFNPAGCFKDGIVWYCGKNTPAGEKDCQIVQH